MKTPGLYDWTVEELLGEYDWFHDEWKMDLPQIARKLRMTEAALEKFLSRHGGHRWPPQAAATSQGATVIERDKNRRLAEYRKLTREQGVTREDAAVRMGICDRTAWRYEKQLRGQENA